MTDRALTIFERRTWNIATRTVHIFVMGVLTGGHVFNVPAERLEAWLYATVVSGALLVVLEAYSGLKWLHQARGVMVIVKLALLLVILFAWHLRVPILFVVVVLGSVGSHMPARYRYYSVIAGEVMK